MQQFYQRLLTILKQPVLRDGAWQLLQCTSGWDGNWTHDNLITISWQAGAGERLIVAVNYSPDQSQGHVRLPFADLAGKPWRLHDQVSGASYDWNGDDLVGRGLYLDMTPWQAAVLEPVLPDIAISAMNQLRAELGWIMDRGIDCRLSRS